MDVLQKLRDFRDLYSDSFLKDGDTDDYSVGAGSPGMSSVGTGVLAPSNKGGDKMKTPDEQTKEMKDRLRTLKHLVT